MNIFKQWPAKFPEEVLDYQFDWVNLLDGDTISGEIEAIPLGSAGLTVNSKTTVGSISTLWISGGTPSPTARIMLKAVTVAGRTIEYAVRLPVRAV